MAEEKDTKRIKPIEILGKKKSIKLKTKTPQDIKTVSVEEFVDIKEIPSDAPEVTPRDVSQTCQIGRASCRERV